MSAAQEVWNRLRLLMAQAKATVVGHGDMQVEALSDEPLPSIKRVQPYGYSYRPHPGAQAYVVFPGGDRSFGLCLVVGDEQYMMELAPGEVALHDDEGNYVHIQRGGVIEVRASTKVLADTPEFETTGDAIVGGNLRVAGQTTSVGGYYGNDGGPAEMQGGAKVNGVFTVNGKDVSDGHRHTTTTAGQPTSEVI